MTRAIKKILIANRAEIACRIIRTCQRLGIKTVAIASSVDQDLPHTRLADETICLEGALASESYLNIDAILKIAKAYQVDAVHPGYGFLSENANFALALAKEEICFIGPSAFAIESMGSKSKAKAIAASVNVPIIQGYMGENQQPAYLLEQAQLIGFPILIKATHGGGGKGMRVVSQSSDFLPALEACQREAQNAFSNAHVMLEKFIENPRHIEVQVFGDHQGNVIALSERDCSLQRRHQKIIEEAPAGGLEPALRQHLTTAAIAVAKAVQYTGAGTVEFLVDAQNHFYFLEMNTRLQVEHPVTEEILGLDLVEWQIRVAEGCPLPLTQEDIHPQGHAIEVRLYAEDSDNGFLPSIGSLHTLDLPFSYGRVEAGYTVGNEVSPYYDPMLAKLIVKAENRLAAFKKMEHLLLNTHIEGVKTNQKFLLQLLHHPNVKNHFPDIGFIDRVLQKQELVLPPCEEDYILAVLAVWHLERQGDALSPWGIKDDWRMAEFHKPVIRFQLGGQEMTAVCKKKETRALIEINGKQVECSSVLFSSSHLSTFVEGQLLKAQIIQQPFNRFLLITATGIYEGRINQPVYHQQETTVGDSCLSAPMPGRIISLCVEAGDSVDIGTPLLILEAMKMEHTIRAPFKGVVEKLYYAKDDFVEEGVELASIQAA